MCHFLKQLFKKEIFLFVEENNKIERGEKIETARATDISACISARSTACVSGGS